MGMTDLNSGLTNACHGRIQFLDQLDSNVASLSKEPKIIVYSALVLDEVVRKKLKLDAASTRGIHSQDELERTVRNLLGHAAVKSIYGYEPKTNGTCTGSVGRLKAVCLSSPIKGGKLRLFQRYLRENLYEENLDSRRQ